ncbi:MAG: L-histidine N(alpha)-methyltransferase [Bdellovibrio sp.]
MDEVEDILKGLIKNPKSIPSKYFYDDEGSRLFDEITKLDEYYIAKCEKEILQNNSAFFLNLYGQDPVNLIELGPGDGSKASLVIAPLLKERKNFEYHAIDISPRELHKLKNSLLLKFPNLSLDTHIADYMQGIASVPQLDSAQQNIVLFLGSSIGNFEPDQAKHFLKNIARKLKPQDYLIIGFDLKKEERILWRAYNDPRGLTAEFNLNLLRRINKEYGGDFNISDFKHLEIYNPFLGAMESYLVSQKKQSVHFMDSELEISFECDETIHTEYSYKFDKKSILDLVSEAGLTAEQFLFDKKNYVTIGIFKPLLMH